MSSDVFLLPSLWEGFGYVIVEASLSELPIVAFDISSNSEVINESTGFLTPPNDVSTFCDKIVYLYDHRQKGRYFGPSLLGSHPDQRKSMGKAGKNHVKKNFESSKIFNRIESYLIPKF